MLRALLRNKLERTIPDEDDEEGPSVREGVRRSEDALTATVFERLLFLPPERAALLMGVLEGSARLFGPTYPEAYFWPSHRLDGQRVEPDLVLVYADRVVIVEVKWNTAHYEEQWKRELAAAAEMYVGGRELHLVLIGRAWQRSWALDRLAAFLTSADTPEGRMVVTSWLSWELLYPWLETLLVGGEMPPWERAVVADIRDALADRGLRVPVDFGSLFPMGISTTPSALLETWCLAGTEHIRGAPGKAQPLTPLPPERLTMAPADLLAAWRL